MTLPFQPAASPDTSPVPKGKWLVTFDWDETLSLSGASNKPLYHFADLAQAKGHDVLIASNNIDPTFVELIRDAHIGQLKLSLQLPLIHKDKLRDYVASHSYGKSVMCFDNAIDTVPEYADAEFVGEVLPDGSVDPFDLKSLAAVLGIKTELMARLGLEKTNGPAGPFASMDAK